MAFRFAARTLLELGKELISSDEVALYELIKNAVDAGSPRIEVIAEIVVPHSAYHAALEDLDEEVKTAVVLRGLREHIVSGIPDEQVHTFLAPIEESVGKARPFKNALVNAYRECNWIEIRDTGHGMALDELGDVFLTIGTRSRRAANEAGSSFLGDKGVGRLSAMRLGDSLMVTTTREGESHWNELDLDWTLFTHESDVDIGDIPIEPRRGAPKANRSDHGTTIRISRLTTSWNEVRFSDVFQGPIARMVDPFEPGRGNRLLVVRFNGTRVAIPSVPQELLSTAHATCHAEFRFEHGEPVLDGLVDYRLRHKQRSVAQRGAEIYSMAQRVWRRRGKRGHAATQAVPIRPHALRDLGPFSVDVYWFNRAVVDAVDGLTQNRQGTRDAIAQWSGGPMLYRHGFRILPYGDPDDDWLSLDRAAWGSSGFKLNRLQVIGRVQVSSRHTALSEQTNREGLVQSDAAEALKTILMWLMHSELWGLIDEGDRIEKLRQDEDKSLAFEFRGTQQLVEKSLLDLQGHAGPALKSYIDRLKAQVSALSNQCEELVGKTANLLKDAAEEREKFVHLAGIGLMTEFIFHELNRAVVHTMHVLSDAKASGRTAALRALEDQLVTLQKRISAFDELTGERRQSKSLFDLADVLRMVLENHANEFERHSIALNFKPPKERMKIKAVRGMLIQIIENLFSNSLYWMKQQKRYQKGYKPEITIDIDKDLQNLTVEDNGPGIDPSRREVIFQPFVTSKPPGQGHGLGLYISRELAEYHGWQLYLDQQVGRTRAKRLNMFVLDMSGRKQ